MKRFVLYALLLPLHGLLGACSDAERPAYLEISFAGEEELSPAGQTLVRRNLRALWNQATGRLAAPEPSPDAPRLRLVWETAPGRVVLTARAPGADTRPRRYTLRRGDTDLRRHLGVTAFLRQVDHDLADATP